MKELQIGAALVVAFGLLSTTGCVFKETYEAEKARSLNFQRLLAQEEKRTAELDNELKRVKRDSADYEARNRELTAQVQSAREQMGRVQEEADALREAVALQQKAQEQMKKMPSSKPKVSQAPTMPSFNTRPGEGLSFQDTMADSKPEVLVDAASLGQSQLKADADAMSGGKKAIRHEVKPGETVYRLSRRYGTTVEKIREWNNRKDDLIEVGEKIIVGFE
ncbi:hypothetical protein YTPLAS18_19080 [Nitrospira sp.]|nr:hypothetical protein YTPLAS18_19080 [Nitrospira sp.]